MKKHMNKKNEKKIEIEELKKLSTKEIALIGNVDPVRLIIADCDIKQYLKYRIALISDKEELINLKELYKDTEWFDEAIRSIKEEVC